MEKTQDEIYNFSAGPCCLPKEVLKKAQEELLDWNGTGISVMEMSHRSKAFKDITGKAEKDLRTLMNIPDNYHVLFLQGGASLQYSAIPFNLLDDNKKMNYLVTGFWGAGAFRNAKKVGDVTEVIKPLETYNGCTDFSEWTIDKDAKYFHFCDNETVDGVEFHNFPYEELKDQLLVCDMSSNLCSRSVDWNRYGLVYAGAQKNVGPAGVTIVIVRDDLVGKQLDITPDVMNYKKHVDSPGHCYNTPCCWSIYMAGLNIEYMLKKGLDKIEEEAQTKSSMLYDYIDGTEGYYVNPVDPAYRSRINIPFRVKSDEKLEEKFVEEAKKEGLVQLKGHVSVGGIRASIYNAMPIEGVKKLVSFMEKFKEENP
ncbi:unnamed protein product [Moneuplotes crassus]|uniref:Phosphoserine aminotransferase n=1 Tax=Euplotes crassus TaxID=5936 RepID=A0AAD2CXV7_EUPCR|nr:unnamed protein product [Moneuplotes crassus]